MRMMSVCVLERLGVDSLYYIGFGLSPRTSAEWEAEKEEALIGNEENMKIKNECVK